MKLKLDLQLDPLGLSLPYDKPIVLLGSCFSDEMEKHFRHAGFTVSVNSFGTLFHPLAISKAIRSSLKDDQEIASLKRDDLYFSWDSSGKIYGKSEEDLREKLLRARSTCKSEIAEASLLVITLGTAWEYRHRVLNTVVANCHKINQSVFDRSLTEVSEMIEEWRELIQLIKKHNPGVRLVFTVSPVRHAKEGLVENNRSKARLIELVHQLCGGGVDYFPAYEILIDELRDYRFYAKDLVHPSEMAVEIIWERFRDFIFSSSEREKIREVEKVKQSMRHRSLYPESEQEEERQKTIRSQRDDLNRRYSGINWE